MKLSGVYHSLQATADHEEKTYVLEFIRHKDFPAGEFRLAKISIGENVLWQFKTENFNKGYGQLFCPDGIGLVLGLINAKNKKVELVIYFSDLIRSIKARSADGSIRYMRTNPKGPKDTIWAKRAIAEKGGRDWEFSQFEKSYLAMKNKREAEEKKQIVMDDKKRKEERKNIIMSRPELRLYAKDGSQKHGIPVTEEEWPSLKYNTRAILVSSYDDKTRKSGEVIEAFICIAEKGGQPMKTPPIRGLSFEKPQKAKRNNEPAVIITDSELFFAITKEREDEPICIPAISKDGVQSFIRTMKPNLSNQNCLYFCIPTTPGKYQVEKLTADGSTTLGEFQPL